MASSHENRTVKKNRIDGEVHFTVMMPPNVHAALADAAKEHRRSMSDEACVIIQEKLFLNSENQTKARLSLLEGRVDALEKSLAAKTGH
jgi:hypothetical protein